MIGWAKDIVSWKVRSILYMSIPFTWLVSKARLMAQDHNGKVIIGGPGAMLMRDKIDWAEVQDSTPYDVLSMHNPLATFTTRGCPNKCKFCAVPRIEGKFRELDAWKPAPIVCDNNLLACSKEHFERVIESLMPFEYVDFNQGLQAGRFTEWHAEILTRLRHVKLRFALDHIKYESVVGLAIRTARKFGLTNLNVYVLIGYKDTPEDALYRLERVRSWGIRPNPMRFQPLTAADKDSYIENGWDDRQLRKMMRYYGKLRWLEHIPFDEYIHDRNDYYIGDLFEGAGE